MKAVIINGSPRKTWNTAQMLEQAAAGALSAGADVEIINLYDYDYKGCRSCFGCKLRRLELNGMCVVNDGLRPVLEKVHEADVLIMGSPVYYGNATGELMCFLERIFFPSMVYERHADNTPVLVTEKRKQCGLILTMNVAEDKMEAVGYPAHFGLLANTISRQIGPCEMITSCDTLQFMDYAPYRAGMFNEAEKRTHHNNQFPKDLEQAFALGKRLCEA